MSESIRYTVFTKPWKTMSMPELAGHVSGLGFTGVEFPVRPEFQVEPDRVMEGLSEAAGIFADHGVAIESVAGPYDEATIQACGEAGVPMIRICPAIDADGYWSTIDRLKAEFEQLQPVLAASGVAIGIQNHCNNFISSAHAIMDLIGDYSPDQFCAVWDPAHNVLSGEIPEQAIDIFGTHLRMVNFKSPVWLRQNGPEAARAQWRMYWTSGREGIAPWEKAVALLQERGWTGPATLCAEYSDHDSVDRLIADDIAFAKELFGG